MDHRRRTQEKIKEEINNISHRIASVREAQMNATTYGSTNACSNYDWKVPEVEQINRNFNEHARFFNTHTIQRKHGLKFVPRPVADNIQELLNEQMSYDIKNPNYLLNSRYTKSRLGQSLRSPDESINIE